MLEGGTTERRTVMIKSTARDGAFLDPSQRVPSDCAAQKSAGKDVFNLIFAAAAAVIRSGSLVPAREAPISLRPQNAPEVGATARHWYNHLWREGGTLVAVATDYFALLPFGHSTSSEDAAHRKISVGRCHILECAIYNAR